MGVLFNFQAGWAGFLLGVISGMVAGLFFYREEWMGGYGSWRRRMTRLGHVSFFGLGILNVLFALSVRAAGIERVEVASWALIVGAATMPAVCYLSAWRPVARHLFFIPVLSVLVGLGAFLLRLLS